LSAEPRTSVAESSEPQLPVLRFSLKHLFCWVTGVSVLMAALAAAPAGMSPLALLLAVLAVALHVIGTAIGTRLRAHANDRRAWEARQLCPDNLGDGPPPTPSTCFTAESRPRSPLSGHSQPLRRLPLCLVAGAILGGCLGVAILTVTIGNRTTAAGVAVGAVSIAVMGAWLAFVAASSWAIFRQGWRDAVAESRKDDAPGVGQR
jgi:hypothetical protein